ncbi:MAG: AAA family ATPase, partial [Gemmataceae bacterium]|nr:AAA family ATPase [Gemmataceae bacterium]
MKILSVSAHAFGPFVGEALVLAPGMNVVWGPNEAGKSSWHAALYYGICGRRRGQGQPGREERELRARHEPWDGGRWEVGAVITLEDGRHIEL